ILLTIALATPTHDMRIPRNRAVVVLVIDMSQSMRATDVAPDRLTAAKVAGKQFADELTPAINLGLVEFAANASLLVSPTTNRAAVKAAIDSLKPAPKTATGEGLFTALQAIATVGSVMGGGEGPPPVMAVALTACRAVKMASPVAVLSAKSSFLSASMVAWCCGVGGTSRY
ncbi:VWA domain-containing protein, partial [Mycobacterium sp. E342]|uniref:VWA domain-containing protein n=1 Tax=Mycobacterium sp. E342 TaxID=1834147 RepID=UPI000AD28FD3